MTNSEFRSSASIETLKIRADLLRRVRAFFDRRGFFEVQTPLLSADTVVDRHVDPVPVSLPGDPYGLINGDPNDGRAMWLQTSPEFAMKRLLASGAEAIYQITPAFRIGESGDQHNPEFTMLEWYRCGDEMQQGIALLSAFVAEILDLPPADVKTIRQVCVESLGVDPLVKSSAELKVVCKDRNVVTPESIDEGDWDTWFDLLFTEFVQPKLGYGTPTVVHDYPSSQAALARVRKDEPDVAERFELFVNGTELANGYHELLEAAELLERNSKVNQLRAGDGKLDLPNESRLLDAMRAGLPACAGVALGFDRLVMLATGEKNNREVIPFPIDRA